MSEAFAIFALLQDKDMTNLGIPHEVWKDIPNYESLYQVSNIGRIKALSKPAYHNHSGKSIIRKERLLTQKFTDHCGYKNATLTDTNGKQRAWLSHRLIALTFIPNPENKRCVNHKNGIKTDNRLENLEWATHSENSIHSFAIGTQCNKGSKHPSHKLTEEQIIEIRAKYKPYVYERKALAIEYNVDWTTIKDIVSNKTWKHI